MYVCNMLEDEFKSKRVSLMNGESVTEGFFKNNGVNLQQVGAEDGSPNIFDYGLSQVEEGKEVYRAGKVNGRRGKYTYKMIKDTPENPLIIVLCKEISLYEGIETDLRWVNLGGDVIMAMLVSGACDFDGTPMQRCNTQDLSNRKLYKYSAKGLEELSRKLFISKGLEYYYGNDIVCPVSILHDAEGGFSAKRTQTPYFLDKKGYDSASEKWEELQRKKAEEEEQRRIERAEREERVRKELEEKKAQEEAERKAKVEKQVNKAKIKSEPTKVLEGSAGAASFLAAVAAIQNKK